jgi:hypothetical protein
MPITDVDERRHPVEDPDEHWSDSLYFNGFDLGTGACFLTRMAVLPNQPGANALWLAWLDGEPSYGYYRSTEQLPAADWDATSIDGVTYRMIEPLRRWTLALDDGGDKAFVEFDGYSPCFDYADNRAPLPRAVAWGHFEQSGTVRGDLQLGGHEISFDGVGQRDHSWGSRRWDGVREWHWVTGLLGTQRSFNLFQVVDPRGGVTANGFVYDAGTIHPVVRADRRTREAEGRVPEAYELTLEVEGGGKFEFVAERSHTAVALRPGATTVQEAPMRIASDGLAGVGIYELLFNGAT